MNTEYIITAFPLYSLWFKTDNPFFLNLQLFQTKVGITTKIQKLSPHLKPIFQLNKKIMKKTHL